jgi:glycosyltransferase involved in cell wall biosynthesis
MKLAEAKRMRDEELGLALAADVTVAVSDDDRNTLLALAPLAVVKVVPCIFDVPSTPPPSLCNRAGLFFIGGFWHTPNGDGIKWFVERILPLIQAEIPDVVLRIAGSNMGDDILALGVLPGVEVLGFVPEVEPLLDQHRVFIAPLRFGAGMKGKVAQSLANGLPVVATKIGAEGMTLVPGTHILVADEETRFADEVVRLLRDDDLWQRLSKQGRSHIESTLSRKIVSEQLGALLDG